MIKSSIHLRTSSISDYQYGNMKTLTCYPRHYVKVEKRFFDTIKVNLTNEHGEKLPFEFGTASVVLHFKRQ